MQSSITNRLQLIQVRDQTDTLVIIIIIIIIIIWLLIISLQSDQVKQLDWFGQLFFYYCLLIGSAESVGHYCVLILYFNTAAAAANWLWSRCANINALLIVNQSR